MTTRERVTLSIPSDLLAQVKEASAGNLSKFFVEILENYLEDMRLQKLEQDLIAAALAKADEDLAIAHEFRFIEHEVIENANPPYQVRNDQISDLAA